MNALGAVVIEIARSEGVDASFLYRRLPCRVPDNRSRRTATNSARRGRRPDGAERPCDARPLGSEGVVVCETKGGHPIARRVA